MDVPKELLYESLIGKEVEITESTTKNQVGMKGILLFESANLFYMEINGSTKQILKENITFKLTHNGKPLYIDGRFLSSTITHRIKKIK